MAVINSRITPIFALIDFSFFFSLSTSSFSGLDVGGGFLGVSLALTGSLIFAGYLLDLGLTGFFFIEAPANAGFLAPKRLLGVERTLSLSPLTDDLAETRRLEAEVVG